jgi:SAM-dependent methyltransferase
MGLISRWHLDPGGDAERQINALLDPLYAKRWLPDGHESIDAILMGEQYHLGGAEDTRRMAQALDITASDRVVDLACYIGGPARQLAREYGCAVVGVDISPVHIAVAERLTELTGLADRVRFVCASADAVPEPDGSFTVAWSQCSFPEDLSWVREMDRLLAPGGRLAFTGLIKREWTRESELLSLAEMVGRVEAMGYRVMSAEDISGMDLEYGWLPARRKLEENEARYVGLMGEEWVDKAYASIDADMEAWREARMGNGRVVGVKGG